MKRLGRKKKVPLDSGWFSIWFNAMPLPWQAGLLAAQSGQAFIGDLLTRSEPKVEVVVMFVPPHVAAVIEKSILGSKGGDLT